jgi:hypothetical protein
MQMTTLCKAYTSEVAARQAVEALRTAGLPGRDIRLLTGSRLHDVRREPVGGFAGILGPDARVGTYAGIPRLRRQGAGSFAGDPDRQRQGSFADTDRDMIATHEHDGERARVTGDVAIRRLLRAASVTGEAAARTIDELHAGHAVVVAEVAEIAPNDARARLEEVAPAA